MKKTIEVRKSEARPASMRQGATVQTSASVQKRPLWQQALALNLSVALAFGPTATGAYAAATVLADAPLVAINEVKPNVMFILDDSGSMSWFSLTGTDATAQYNNTRAEFYSSTFNQIYYNPNVTYQPGVNANKSSRGNSPPTAAPNDSYGILTGTTNLTALCYSNTSNPALPSGTSSPTSCLDNPSGSYDKGPFARNSFYYEYKGTGSLTNASSYNRRDILSTVPNYTRSTARTDCAAAPICTYAEEIQNFANWWTYYRNRMMTMKTAVGLAFKELDDSFRVGFTTHSYTGVDNNNAEFLNISDFDSSHKTSWYTKLYNANPTGGTPLRPALSKVGRIYAGKVGSDPVQYSCQHNFTILSTDGYWNGGAGYKEDGTSAIGNQDNVDAGFSKRVDGAFDGGFAAATDTLSDVAMYYYKTDLRPGMTDNVPSRGKDKANHQHMVTFTVGLGVNGTKPYISNYETATSGFYYNVTQGTDNWPIPAADNATAVDDLWHAAVNGRGTYFSAKDPAALATSLASIMNEIIAAKGTAVGAALQSPDLNAADNDISVRVEYNTSDWSGKVEAYNIDPTTGAETTKKWDAQALLNTMTGGTGWDTSRFVVTMKDDGSKVPFRWSNLSSTQQSHLIDEDRLKWLRGDKSKETSKFRKRDHVLGDVVNSRAEIVGNPRQLYSDSTDPGYSSYKSTSRTKMVYVGANDGMLHAFDASTGAERFAYIPSLLIRPISQGGVGALAQRSTDTPPFQHYYYVDGTPVAGDVDFNNTNGAGGSGAWRTILVGGLNKGGRGFYALDVTSPTVASETAAAGKVLWEFPSSANPTHSTALNKVGYSYGRPRIVKTRAHGWVVLVTSGYNNGDEIGGDGKGYLFVLDAKTGNLLYTFNTTAGTSSDPSGLANVRGYVVSHTDNTVEQVYGGDLKGNLWRFDLSAPNTASWVSTATLLATLRDGSGAPQPITALPQVEVDRLSNERWIFVGTGRYLGLPDLTDTQRQTMYAIKDGDKTAPGVVGTPITRSSLSPVTAVTGTSTTSSKGWYIDLDPGERIVADLVADLQMVAFATLTPSTDKCSPGFTGRGYAREYSTGRSLIRSGTTVIPYIYSAQGIVSVNFVKTTSSPSKIRLRFGKGDGTSEFVDPEIPAGGIGSTRVSWREIME